MTNKSRLVWRCRRGTRELDLILGRFLEQCYDQLAPAERVHFERLLDQEDDQLQAWLIGDRRPMDEDLARLVERILAAV
jgi:antitoxin CptB